MKDYKKVGIFPVIFNNIFVIIDIGIAYDLQKTASSAAIIFIAGITYFVTTFIDDMKRRKR